MLRANICWERIKKNPLCGINISTIGTWVTATNSVPGIYIGIACSLGQFNCMCAVENLRSAGHY